MLNDVVAADAVRLTVFILGFAVLGVAARIVVVYATIYTVHRRLSKTTDLPKWRGLLPRHVAFIGVSYIVLVLATLTEVAFLIGEPLTWKSPVYGVAYASGLFSLVDVMRSSQHRKHELKQRTGAKPKRAGTRRHT